MFNDSDLDGELAKRDLIAYCRRIDDKYDTETPLVQFLATHVLNRVESGELEKVIVTVCPRSGKSKLLSRFSSWWLGRHPGQSLLLLSASQSLAIRNSRWIRDDVTSDKYPWSVTIDDDASSILAWRTSTGSEVRTFSVNSILTGQTAHMVLADDLQADMMSGATRDSLEEWLRSVAETRREPNAPFVLLNNRWSTDDLVARLASGPDADDWSIINIPALCEDPQTDVLGRKEVGATIWPAKWTPQLLAKKKAAVGQTIWDASYQGHPVPEGGRLINVLLFNDYAVLPTAPVTVWDPSRLFYESPLDAARPETDECFLTLTGIDCSGVTTTTTSGSFNAIVTVVLDTRTGDIFLRDIARARNISFEELRALTIRKLETYNPNLVLIENMAQGGRLGGDLQRSTRFPVRLIEAKQSKEERCIAWLPLLEGGKLYVNKSAPYTAEFLRELSDFPAGRHNDMVDAYGLCLAYARVALARRADDRLWEQQLRQLEGGFMAR